MKAFWAELLVFILFLIGFTIPHTESFFTVETLCKMFCYGAAFGTMKFYGYNFRKWNNINE